MGCTKCGAPLPGKSNICRHCGTLNDVDLRAVRVPTVQGPQSGRVCPECDTEMGSISLRLDKEVFIERCETCSGIFFDPDELEAVIDASVSKVFEVDLERMAIISEEMSRDYTDVKYVRCPVCQTLMNRRNYGARSGVIVDLCSQHGVWLNGGELRRLLHWVKAGGLLHDREKRQKDKEQAERKRRQERVADVSDFSSGGSLTRQDYSDLPGVLGLLLGFME